MSEPNAASDALDKLQQEFENFERSTAERFYKELVESYQQRIDEATGKLFESVNTLTSETASLLGLAKTSHKQQLLGQLVRTVDLILTRKAIEVDDILGELEQCLVSTGVQKQTVHPNDRFDPDKHVEDAAVPGPPETEGLVAEAHGPYWLHDGEVIQRASVKVFRAAAQPDRN